MIGLLLDSLSDNTGDQAITEVMISTLRDAHVEYEVVSPLHVDVARYGVMVIGGGHLLRHPGDWYYDNFRIPGHHILNSVGATTSQELDYLSEYQYVSVRSERDRRAVEHVVPNVVVSPCPALALKPETRGRPIAEGSIGFHFHAEAWDACGGNDVFLDFGEMRQALLPITHYNGDEWLLRRLATRLPTAPLLIPKLPPRSVVREIASMRAFVSSSLHGAIFAYSQNVPFLLYSKPDKMAAFMEDRGLQHWLFGTASELRTKLREVIDAPPDYSDLLKRDQQRLGDHLKRIVDLLPKTTATVSEPRRPALTDRMLMRQHHRLEVLERITNELAADTIRFDTDVQRLEGRLGSFLRAVEECTGSKNHGETATLPFGIVELIPCGPVRDVFVLSGWALASFGIGEVAVYLNGRLSATAVYGLKRPDLARAYPDIPDSDTGGWTATVNIPALKEGEYEVLVQARSLDGQTRDLRSFTINVERD